jgi:hypothetical protein
VERVEVPPPVLGPAEHLNEPPLLGLRVRAAGGSDPDLDVERDRPDVARALQRKGERQRRCRRVLENRCALDGEIDHGGDRFGIRGSIGPAAFGFTPVLRSEVDVPSLLWPTMLS